MRACESRRRKIAMMIPGSSIEQLKVPGDSPRNPFAMSAAKYRLTTEPRATARRVIRCLSRFPRRLQRSVRRP